MKKENLSELSATDLQLKLKSAKTIQYTVIAIFVLIILAWIILGYWLTNTPVFISTLAIAIAATISVSVAPRNIEAELKNRNQEKSE